VDTELPKSGKAQPSISILISLKEIKRKESAMCILQAHMQCFDRFFEVFSNEVEQNELILENVVSQLLLDFFDEVTVDVNINFSPHEKMGLQHCSIQIQAQCENQINASLSDPNECIELSVEHRICSILRELFCSVIVDNVTFIPSPRDHKYAHSSAGRV
jgi:hypothetical protein